MKLCTGYVRLLGAQFVYRANIVKISYLFKNSIYVKNISTSCEGVLFKPHLLSTLQHEALYPAYNVLDKNDCVADMIVTENCLDDRNRIVIYNAKNVVHISKLNPVGDIYGNEDFLLNQEFKNIISNSSFHYDVSVVHCLPTEHQILSHALASFSAYQPFIIYFDFTLRTLNTNVMLSESQEPRKETETLNQQDKPSEECLLNVINHLSDSLLNFFRISQDFSIYHQDIVFQNNFKGITTRGISNYKKQMYMLQIYGHLRFSKVKVKILKITHHLEDGTVRVRWRFIGLSRSKMLSQWLKHKLLTWKEFPEQEPEWVDGFSIFSVDKNGLIYKHICDKMIPDDDEKIENSSNIKARILTLLGVPDRPPTNVGGVHGMFPCPVMSCSVKIQEKIK